MAGPEVGDIYLQTHADTKGLAAEIRRAAAKAGKDFGTQFTKGVDQSMGGLGNQIRDKFGGDKYGRMTAGDFAKAFQDDIKKRNWDFDIDLGQAIRTGDFGPMLEDVEDVNAQLERMRTRITTLGKGGAFTKLGTDTETVQKQLTAYVDELNDAARVQDEAAKASDDLAASQKKQAAALQENQNAMKAWNADIAYGIQQSEKLAKANQKAAGKEQAAQLRDNQAAMRAMNKEIAEGIRYSEQLARAANFTENTKQTNAYRDAVADTAKQLQTMQTQLKKMGSGKEFKGQEAAIARLSGQVRTAAEDFTRLQRAGRDALVGLDRSSTNFGDQMTRNAEQVRAFSGSLKDMDAEIDVHANYPSAAEARAQGTLLGLAFRSAVDKATSKPAGGGGGGGKGIFDSITSEWQQFLYAFPAEVTILARYIALIGTEVGTIGSAIGSTLTAAVSSLAVGVTGLGAAAGGVFTGMAYSIVLASQAMKTFEDSFPATQSALDNLKDTFESVDVAGFAAAWSDSVRGFANTLSTVISGAQLGSTFGEAAAQITNTFAGILQTPAFTGFIGALQNQIPAALVGIGNGMGALATALLPVLTAAAPLAESLATQFANWAGGLATAASSAEGLSSISDFMTLASVSIQQLVSLVSNLGGALGNVFVIGADSGNRLLATLAGLAGQFRAFTESASGQSSIALWFSQGEQVMNAIIPLLGAVGQMFGDLVTPATVAQLVGLINGLTQLTPVLGQIMAAFGQLNFLGILVQALNAIGTALSPVLPAIGELAGIIGGVLGQAIVALQPALNTVGQVLGSLAPIVGQVVQQLGGALAPVLGLIQPIIAALAPVLGAVAQAFGNLVAGALPAISAILTSLTPVFESLGQMIAALAPGLVTLFVAFNPVLRLFTLLLPALQPIISLLAPIVTFIADLATQFAAVLNPILEAVGSMLTFSKALAPVSGALGKAGGGFEGIAKAASGFVEGIAKQLPQIATTIANVVGKIATGLAQVLPQIATALQSVLPALAATLSQIIPAIVGAITQAVPVLLNAAIDLFTTLVTAVTTVLPQVLQAILTALPQLITTILGLIPVLLQAAIQLFTALVQAVVTVVPMLLETVLTLLPQLITTILGMIPMLLQTAVQLFLSIVQALVTAIPQILTALLGLLPQLITAILGMIPMLLQAGIQLFVSIVTAIVTAIPQILTALLGMLPGLLTTILGMIPQLITAGINLFVSLVTAIAKALPQILTALFDILPKLLDTLIKMIPRLITTGIQVFISLVTAIAKALPQILSALFGILPSLTQTLIKMIPTLITAAIQLFVAIVQGISGAWPDILSALQGLGSDILDALGNIDLAQIGRDIMQSLWDGLQARWDDVTGWVSGIGGWIADHKGPPSYDRVLLTPAGRQIMDGLQAGLIQGMPGLRRTLGQVTGAIDSANFRTQVDLVPGAQRGLANDVMANTGGRNVYVEAGAIQVTPVVANPELVASAVVDRMVLAMQ